MKNDYNEFILNVKHHTGIDLGQYKEAQMKRRLTTLREKRGFGDFNAYFSQLKKDSALLDEFLDRMTINVSEFYRNYKRWEILDKKVIPELLKQTKRLKVWSAACSTGEEPYSLAMLLSEHLPLNQIDIVATDLDINALKYAKKGVYMEKSLKEIPMKMKEKYFTKDGAFYKIDEKLKGCIRFKEHNLLADDYGSGFDLIVCRNVLIYFTEEAKETIYRNFSNALKPGGVFFVGSTEQIFSPKHYGLEVLDTFFYQRR
ncbi:CheR family methyltransferase [Thalassobacillus hwangdonensis]|uniref:protein-glutamate O-methyltransferase n=1 Tax=Thalassobacillus hwangdonensis TaxID=546108 RepID=A0ABW3KZH0_9BACI